MDAFRKFSAYDAVFTATAIRLDSAGNAMPPDPLIAKAHSTVLDRKIMLAKKFTNDSNKAPK